MSQIAISKKLLIDGVLTDATTVKLSSSDGTYGVRRTDTLASVVADGTDMTHEGTGLYTYTFTEPDEGLTYEYAVEIVYDGETTRFTGTLTGTTEATTGTVSLYTLTQHLTPYLPGCPDPIIKKALRDSFSEFCQNTFIWLEEVAVGHTVADQEEYDLVSGYDAEVLFVQKVEVDGYEWDFSYHLNEDVIEFDTAPTTADLDIVAWVVLKPRSGVYVVPAWIVARWWQGIVALAKHNLKSMAGTAFYDPKGAELALREYGSYQSKARGEAVGKRGGTSSYTDRAVPREFY